jgi:hypothetical protein
LIPSDIISQELSTLPIHFSLNAMYRELYKYGNVMGTGLLFEKKRDDQNKNKNSTPQARRV